MSQPAHEWPKPMFRDGQIYYACNQKDWNLHAQASVDHTGVVPPEGFGWRGNYTHLPFPKALHGPNGQSLKVNNQTELDEAIENGWSLKPVGTEVEEVEQEVTPHHSRPPKPLKIVKKKKD